MTLDMPAEDPLAQTAKTPLPVGGGQNESGSDPSTGQEERLSQTGSILRDLEAQLGDIARQMPRIRPNTNEETNATEDLHALLEISLAINATVRLEDTLQIVMKNAIDLLSAERGFIMLLDDYGSLQFKTAYNLQREEVGGEDFRISSSIANRVAETGKAIFASDAQDDERFLNQASIQELHLRSIMCVPLQLKNNVIGVIYLDNSRQAKHFIKSDLYVFQLLAGLAAAAIHNATLYEHLLDMKKFTESVVNKSPVGILVIDSEYQLISINDAGLEIFDKDKNGISLVTDSETPTRFLEMIPESEISRWRQMIDIAFTTKQSFDDARYFHNTGYVEKALNIKLSPFSKLPLGGDGLIMVLEDITEKVIMEKYVILSEKLVARGEMAASIGHELNNYLTIINNNAELLSMNIKENKFEKVDFNCSQIIENIDKMTRFTNGLMDHSKLDGEFINYDIKRLLEDLLFSLRAQTRFKEILFSVDIAGILPSFLMDVGQIQQVFLNLFNNAADALEEREAQEKQLAEETNVTCAYEKKLGIRASIDEGQGLVSIEVSDNAFGMNPETLQKLFQPHFTTKKTGHGLGLVNCQKIAQRHKGSLTAESTEGEGSVFCLTLPLNRDDKNDDERQSN